MFEAVTRETPVTQGIARFIAPIFSLEVLALVVIAAIVYYQLFVDPIVGVADNRDYYRVMRQIGVAYAEDPELTVFKNIQRKFLLTETSEVKYLTSAVPIGHIAVSLSRLISKDGFFDIRMMGLVNGTFYLGATGAFLAAFRRSGNLVRSVVAVAAVVVFSDVRLVSYFNSFLSESAQLVSLVATVGLALALISRAHRKTVSGLLYAAYLLAAVSFCLAKNQDAIFCVPLAAVAYLVCPVGRWSRVIGALAGCGFIALMSWVILSDAYLDTRHMNVRVVVNEEILVYSPNRESDLVELALEKEDAGGLVRVAKFYANHPVRWWELAKRRAKMTFDYLPFGNFERPFSGVSHDCDLWTEWKREHFPRTLGAWGAYLVGYMLILRFKWQEVDRHRNHRAQTLFNVLLVVACILQFIVVTTFEANGPQKHFFIFNVMVDILCLLTIVDLLVLLKYGLRTQLGLSSRALSR